MGKIKRTNAISEPTFYFVLTAYPQVVGCVKRVNDEIGEDLAVCAIAIEKMDAPLFSKPGQDKSGRLDTSLFEIDSHKFIISDSRTIKNFQDVAIGEVMNQMENVDYIVDVHDHYNERKGVRGQIG